MVGLRPGKSNVSSWASDFTSVGRSDIATAIGTVDEWSMQQTATVPLRGGVRPLVEPETTAGQNDNEIDSHQVGDADRKSACTMDFIG